MIYLSNQGSRSNGLRTSSHHHHQEIRDSRTDRSSKGQLPPDSGLTNPLGLSPTSSSLGQYSRVGFMFQTWIFPNSFCVNNGLCHYCFSNFVSFTYFALLSLNAHPPFICLKDYFYFMLGLGKVRRALQW